VSSLNPWRSLAPLVAAACVVVAAQAQSVGPRPLSSDAPVVENFDLEEVAELRPGVALRFSVFGTPSATVTLAIEGGRSLVDLPETEPGIYEGAYVIDARDRIRADSRVVATMQRGGRTVQSRLGEPLQLAQAATPRSIEARSPVSAGNVAPEPMPALAAQACADCAIVESVEVDPSSSVGVVGTLSGAVAGLAAHHPLGEDHGRRVMRVVDALSGSWLGRAIERRTASPHAWRVVLRLPDGSALQRRYDAPPSFRAGDTVRLSAGDVPAKAAPPIL
jgi:outer membrane lipoprotein SlyB